MILDSDGSGTRNRIFGYVPPRVIYDRVRNRKNYFEIAAILNEELQEHEIQMKTQTNTSQLLLL